MKGPRRTMIVAVGRLGEIVVGHDPSGRVLTLRSCVAVALPDFATAVMLYQYLYLYGCIVPLSCLYDRPWIEPYSIPHLVIRAHLILRGRFDRRQAGYHFLP